MSILDVLFKYGLDKFDEKFFQKEKWSVQDHLQVLYNHQKTLLDWCRSIRGAIRVHYELALMTGTALAMQEISPYKPRHDNKNFSEAAREYEKTSVKNFIQSIDDTLPDTTTEIEKSRKSIRIALGNHVKKLLFFFEEEGFPDLEYNIYGSTSYFYTSLYDINEKLSDLRHAADTSCDVREMRSIVKQLATLASIEELEAKLKATIQELMAFAKKKNWDQIFPKT